MFTGTPPGLCAPEGSRTASSAKKKSAFFRTEKGAFFV